MIRALATHAEHDDHIRGGGPTGIEAMQGEEAAVLAARWRPMGKKHVLECNRQVFDCSSPRHFQRLATARGRSTRVFSQVLTGLRMTIPKCGLSREIGAVQIVAARAKSTRSHLRAR